MFKVSDACSANNGLGPCSTLCLPKPNGYTCACEDGVRLLADERTCENGLPYLILIQTHQIQSYPSEYMDLKNDYRSRFCCLQTITILHSYSSLIKVTIAMSIGILNINILRIFLSNIDYKNDFEIPKVAPFQN